MKAPDGYVFMIKEDRLHIQISEARELVTCKSCSKSNRDECPMKEYWETHPADDDFFCAYGARTDA